MSIEKKLKEKIDNHEIISFDIFDTLLVRPYVKPTDLFSYIEKRFNIAGYAQARIEAEIRARREYKHKEDITLEQIYQFLPKQYKKYKKEEILQEKKTLRANPLLQEIYHYCVEAKKRIIITSNMYLSKKFLGDVLKTAGYTNNEKIYISNEVNANKYGTLYSYVLKDLGISPDKMLHIGDNQKADIEKAQAHGIDAWYIPKVVEQYFVKHPEMKEFYENFQDDLGCSIYISQVALREITSNEKKSEESYFYDIGYKYGGCLCYQFMSWLNQESHKKKLKDIIFVARDGYTLQKVYDMMKDKDVKTYYVHAPRKVSLVASLKYNKYSSSHVKCVADYYRQDNKEYTYEENLAYLEQHKEAIEKRAKEKLESFREYMKQYKISHNKVGVVDIATLWATSQKLIAECYPDKKTYGFYWRCNGSFDTEHYKVEFFDKKSETSSILKPYDFVEFLFTSPEMPISDIQEGRPIYKEGTEYDKYRSKVYPYVSSGIEAFCKEIYALFGSDGGLFTPITSSSIIRNFYEHPSLEDKHYMQNIKHATEIDHKSYQYLFEDWYDNRNIDKGLSTRFIKNNGILPKIEDVSGVISKIEKNNNRAIVLTTDEAFVKYTGVTLQSIVSNSTNENFYDIIIFEDGITDISKMRLTQTVSGKDNFSIRYYNIKKYFNKIKLKSNLKHVSVATFYRYVIPEVLQDYEKVIYIDTDTVVCKDIAHLYNYDISNYYLGACKEPILVLFALRNKQYEEYFKTKCYIESMENEYFQAGVLLFNTQKMREDNISYKMLKVATGNYVHSGQDPMNIVCKGKVYFLPLSYNITPWFNTFKDKDIISKKLLEEYNKGYQNPNIIHYASDKKPWKDMSLPMSEIWWKYARESLFYEMILYDNLTPKQPKLGGLDKKLFLDIIHHTQLKLKYYIYKFYSLFVTGKKRKQVKEKKKELKQRIKRIKKIMQGEN